MKRAAAEEGGSEAKRARPGRRDRVVDKNAESSSLTTEEAEQGESSSTATSATSTGQPGKADAGTNANTIAVTSTTREGTSASLEQGGGGPREQSGRSPSPDWVVSPSGSHLSQHFIERLQNFFTYHDNETKRYNIDRAPASMQWGAGDLARFLCEDGQPVLMWLVCELSKDYFLCAPGCNPAKSISASVGMLREKDLVSARRILQDYQRFTAPQGGKKAEADTIRLSRKTSSFSRTKQVITWLFEDIYDGRHEFGPKDSLTRIRPDELGTGDILLAECFVTRYHCDAEGKPVYERPFETLPWTRWRTGFEMKYLTLLRSGEDTAPTSMPAVDDSKTKRM